MLRRSSPSPVRYLLPVFAAAVLLGLSANSWADDAAGICEVVNDTTAAVRFVVTRSGQSPREYTLSPRGTTQISTTNAARLEMTGVRTLLAPGVKYAFRADVRGGVSLARAGNRTGAADKPLASPKSPSSPRGVVPPPVSPGVFPPAALAPSGVAPRDPAVRDPAAGPAVAPTKVAVISVKICVDDEEAARREVWQKRLADRLAAASKITEEAAGVRFQVAEYGTWDTDDRERDFNRALSEFEKEVEPAPARLAIGFSSQYEVTRGETSLGGTRGPLRPHVLVREWSRNISESERLEVLVHELGHFLGAVHSRDAKSVMRPKLGDKQSRDIKFAIEYDDANRRIVRLIGDELRRRPVRGLADLSARTKADLLARYDELVKIQPEDKATRIHIGLIEQAGGQRK